LTKTLYFCTKALGKSVENPQPNKERFMKKTVIQAVLAASIVAMAVVSAIPARADDAPAAPKVKKFTCYVVLADSKANTLSVRKVTETTKVAKTFTVDAKTTYSTPDKKTITLADLKPGDKVTVSYTEANKVLTATAVAWEAAALPPPPAK
jgi:hypothetical protein